MWGLIAHQGLCFPMGLVAPMWDLMPSWACPPNVGLLAHRGLFPPNVELVPVGCGRWGLPLLVLG
jgi:hypothetical protein